MKPNHALGEGQFQLADGGATQIEKICTYAKKVDQTICEDCKQ